MSLRIRGGQPADAAALAAFNVAMALETEDKRLDLGTVSRGVAGVLGDPARGRYFVAEDAPGSPAEAPAIVGALYITREWSDWRDAWFWWIQSVYVPPERRRQGVYRALYAEVEALARDAGDVCGLRLYVEGENHPARATYEQLGMAHAGYAMYEVDWA